MESKSLKDLGLTQNESSIYKALLEIGPSLAGQISRKTGLHRRTVYDTTEMLIQKGLIGYIIKNNRRHFQASSPEKFLDIIKEKENLVNEILPEMMLMYKNTNEKQETNFYKGRSGIRTIFEDQLKENPKEILILGGSHLAHDIMSFYLKWYNMERTKKKIKMKIIFNEKPSKRKIPHSEVRFLPEKYSSPMAINIYGDKIAIILWSKENPIGILIKNKEISGGYKKYFELMWKVAKNEK